MHPSEAWHRYFLGNEARPLAAAGDVSGVALDLRAALVRSLGRFYLGESSEGRIASEVRRSSDPALDAPLRAAIGLYIREEGRHARELAGAIRALGGALPQRHWSEALFRRGRRVFGLRTKMLTLGAAEVVGIVFYALLSERVPSLAALAATIVRDEERHIELQAYFFARVLSTPSGAPRLRAAAALAGYGAVFACGTLVFLADHRSLLRLLDLSDREVVTRCLRVAKASVLRCVHERARAERSSCASRRDELEADGIPDGDAARAASRSRAARDLTTRTWS
jgi:hypothetical protein